MKKSLATLICVSLLLVFTYNAKAENYLDVVLFPVKVLMNHSVQEADEEYQFLNYKGHTYVPMRYIADHTKSGIYYNKDKNEVNYLFTPNSSFAETASVKENADFRLNLLSSKQMYNVDDTINIWSELTYVNENKADIYHTIPMLRYQISNKKGFLWQQSKYDVYDHTIFNKNSQFKSELTQRDLEMYNYVKSDLSYNDFLNKTINPYQLEPGDYEISVTAEYKKDNKENSVTTSFTITIQ